jgi:hypothetical protein
MAPVNTGFTPTPRDDSNGRAQDLPACDGCGRPFLDQAQVAEYKARAKQQREAQRQQIAGLVEQARREEKAASNARDNAEIQRLTACLAQKDEERDEVVRQQVEAGIAAEQLRHTGDMATKDALIDRLRRENESQRRVLDDRKAKDKGTAAEIDLAAVLQKGAKHENIKLTKSGARGADVLEPVSDKGRVVASIFWERKAGYASFSKDWPAKLSEDEHRQGADLGVIVADVLPEGVDGVGKLAGCFVCKPEYVPVAQRFLRHHLISMAREKARGGTGQNAQAALAAFMTGEGREAIEDAKRAGDDIQERGRLLKEYVENTHNGAIKKALRRQNLAFERIFTALNEVQGGGDDEN